jgi:tRNA G26 N,N-dimethylase Trm1
MGGPIWAEPIHAMPFVTGMLEAVKAAPPTAFGTRDRMAGMLTLVSEVCAVFPAHTTHTRTYTPTHMRTDGS